MMRHAARICSHPGCPEIAVDRGRCARHAQQQYERAMMDRREYDEQRPSPSALGYDWHWTKVRQAYLRANPYCVVCGEPATDVDHIMPKVRGGSDDFDNLQAFCHVCHSRKTAQEIRGPGGRWLRRG